MKGNGCEFVRNPEAAGASGVRHHAPGIPSADRAELAGRHAALKGIYETLTADTVKAILHSALAVKAKVRAFATESDETYDHMSFYLNGIKEVEGKGLIDAILAAWADLPEAFAKSTVCVMRRQDYYAAIRHLANASEPLWGKKPEDILGLSVKFVDRAVTPIVGDFRFARQNYDIGTIYDTDKDGEKGEYYFVLTVWGDHRIRLKNAFRLAKVKQ